MIDSEKTLDIYGYHVSELSPKSHKKVVAVCRDCGTERFVRLYAYRQLCNPCSRKSCYISPETRKRRSQSFAGEKNPFYGRHHTEESKKKIRDKLYQLPKHLVSGEAAKNKVIAYYIRGAKRRNLKFELSATDVDDLFKGDCYYCGLKPSTVRKHGVSNGEFVYNGIDRVNNKVGYSSVNCVSCCTKCNMKKQDSDICDFAEWVKTVYQKLKSKKFYENNNG